MKKRFLVKCVICELPYACKTEYGQHVKYCETCVGECMGKGAKEAEGFCDRCFEDGKLGKEV